MNHAKIEALAERLDSTVGELWRQSVRAGVPALETQARQATRESSLLLQALQEGDAEAATSPTAHSTLPEDIAGAASANVAQATAGLVRTADEPSSRVTAPESAEALPIIPLPHARTDGPNSTLPGAPAIAEFLDLSDLAAWNEDLSDLTQLRDKLLEAVGIAQRVDERRGRVDRTGEGYDLAEEAFQLLCHIENQIGAMGRE